jgi:hypothetical protein
MAHVVFQLPSGVYGTATIMAAAKVRAELKAWAVKYPYATYTTELDKYEMSVLFDQPESLTLFALTGNDFVTRTFLVVKPK